MATGAVALPEGAGLVWESAGGALGAAAGAGGVDGEPAPPGAELLLGVGGRPAACLHLSDSESLCSLRQATIRPPPGCTVAQNFCASSAQAARIAASGSCPWPDCAALAGKTEKIVIASSRQDAIAIPLAFISTSLD